jgi:hypothetical protein
MSELMFVVKTLLLSALLVTLMQIRVSGTTVESRAQAWLETSSVAHFVQGAAAGGVLAVRDLYRSISDAWTGSKESKNQFKASK